MKSLILGLCLTALTLHAADGIELKPLQPFVDEVIAQFSKDADSEVPDGLPSQVQRWLGYGLMDWKGI